MVGTLVGVVRDYPLIYLPKATTTSVYSTRERPTTVQTAWDRIEKIVQKNQQLLFSFMKEL